jgi:hypothetical protein
MSSADVPADGDRTGQTPKAEEVPDPLALGPVVIERQREYPVGTRRLTSAGYVNVKCGNDALQIWESEGRLVLERHLCRRLRADEEVRHQPGVDRWDNRLEGLELWRRGRPVKISLPRRPPKKRRNWKRRFTDLVAALEADASRADLERLMHPDD